MTRQMTVEQQQALDALVAAARQPEVFRKQAVEAAAGGGQSLATAAMNLLGGDFLTTWFGVSREDASNTLQALLGQRDVLEARLLDWVERRPIDTVFEFLASASLAFYVAEKEINPKIRTYVDSFYYIATCASVGYADVFAMTQTGRAIASLVMIVGPALTSRSLDRPLKGTGVLEPPHRPDAIASNPMDQKEQPHGQLA